ncbi:hypothetical protein [Burkholderia sp. Ac-20365]|uniref:hypothetical protein n=1 Tax=Burkholderia sp. Ac-20365 TaxID=2703897 RepID=UPI00197C2E51|nr:hypothetical protein [Burkholderia sp. Ac-20365]MBN3761341.1 hypothetical protein [Burkholderia sp. Ac-20365]
MNGNIEKHEETNEPGNGDKPTSGTPKLTEDLHYRDFVIRQQTDTVCLIFNRNGNRVGKVSSPPLAEQWVDVYLSGEEDPNNPNPKAPGDRKFYLGLFIVMRDYGVFFVVDDDDDSLAQVSSLKSAEQWVDDYWDEQYAGVTVKEAIDADLWDGLHPEIAAIGATSAVGLAAVQLLNSVALTLRIPDLEPSIREILITEALHQCRVWYFG